MPSNKSYNYFELWKKCVHKKYGEFSDAKLDAVFKVIFDIMEKAPSKQMGGAGWCDEFLTNSIYVLCTGEWCNNNHCEHHETWEEPYNCGAGKLPFQCPEWKKWRLQWRSFPEKEECQQCRYYKPHKFGSYYGRFTKEAEDKFNSHKCYCRQKELPDGCPKKHKVKQKKALPDPVWKEAET
jgi:hypothetical protein